MKKANETFKKSLEKALEIIDYTNTDVEVLIDGNVVDVNEFIFESINYPFNMCFQELYFEITMSDEDEVEDDFANKFIDYVNNTIEPLYKKCKENELKRVYCAKLAIMAKMSSYLTITEYALSKVTDKKVFYYECLNKYSDGKDVSYILKNKLDKSEVSFKGVVEAKMWFLGDRFIDKKEVENTLKTAIKEEFDSRLEKLNHCIVSEASYIKRNN